MIGFLPCSVIKINDTKTKNLTQQIYVIIKLEKKEMFDFNSQYVCYRKGPNSMFVHLGEHLLGSTEDGVTKKFAVERVVAHSQFHMEYMWHDIAILRLREPIKFNYNYNPVQLPLDHS